MPTHPDALIAYFIFISMLMILVAPLVLHVIRRKNRKNGPTDPFFDSITEFQNDI